MNEARNGPPGPRIQNYSGSNVQRNGNSNNNGSVRGFIPVPYTQEESEDIQVTLNKSLGPEYVSSRPGAGGQKVSYIEGWKVLNLANEVFGFNGWSSELINTTVDYLDSHGSGRVSLGLSIVVRITIKDGTYHEDIGYGFIDNAKNKAAAFEKCKKEAFTDGLKRCLRCFGNVLGNCLYDKNLLTKLRNVTKPTVELDDSNLYRDRSLIKQEEQRKNTKSVNIMPNQDNNQNNNQNNNQSPNQENNQHNPRNNLPSGQPITTPSAPPRGSDHPDQANKANDKNDDIINGFDDSFMFSDDFMSQNDGIDDYEMQMIMDKANQQNNGNETLSKTDKNTSNNDYPQPQKTNQVPPSQPQHSLFVSAKSADMLKDTPNQAVPFDPKFVSPNIRRTVDPTKSVPIKKNDNAPNNSSTNPLLGGSSQTPSKSNHDSRLGKRYIGLPPSQRPTSKRLRRSSGDSSKDKENQVENKSQNQNPNDESRTTIST